METREQADFFAKITEGAERLQRLARVADSLGCVLLAHNLMAIAGDVRDSIEMQRRALRDDSLAAPEVCASCGHARNDRETTDCLDPFHWWSCGRKNCPRHLAGEMGCPA